MKKLGLRIGEKVVFKVEDKKVLIEPAEDPVENLRGLVKLDAKTAKRIIESPEFEPL